MTLNTCKSLAVITLQKIADSFTATVFSFLQIIHIAYLLTYVGRIKKYPKMEFLRLHSPHLGQVDAVYH